MYENSYENLLVLLPEKMYFYMIRDSAVKTWKNDFPKQVLSTLVPSKMPRNKTE